MKKTLIFSKIILFVSFFLSSIFGFSQKHIESEETIYQLKKALSVHLGTVSNDTIPSNDIIEDINKGSNVKIDVSIYFITFLLLLFKINYIEFIPNNNISIKLRLLSL